ncbi:hypothetical protein GH714_038766 [Hevea brasiliensis]|uniref:SNRNP25 ubiquitin-like domain-containing protein n=1 Tax=Hevea brasiliensis TaxID=3981 RepID=A0A6A6L0F0_HEVBR|nr:hypothetical protein GH714_038766 [Hevea brasiliensis]
MAMTDVHVGRNASVAELKLAVEEVFASHQRKVRARFHGKIPMPGFLRAILMSYICGACLGHFCLSYEGQKLINDKARIQTFGIKDDDQLNNSSVRPLSRDEKKEQRTFANHSDNNENQDYDSKYHCEDHDDIPTSEFKLAHFLRGWLSRKGSQGQSRPSRFSLQCLGGGPRMIELQG